MWTRHSANILAAIWCLAGCGSNGSTGTGSDANPTPGTSGPPAFQCPTEALAALADGDQPLTFRERFALPAPPGQPELESLCGTSDFQDVELYDGTLGVDALYVATHEPSTVQFQWLSQADISARLPDHSPGNVGGVRWCTGTLIAANRALTAAHCFDNGDSSWDLPFSLGPSGPVVAQPAVLATLQVANFRYQVNAATSTVRTPDRYPITRLVEYGFPNLDYAIVELGRNAAGQLPGDVYEVAELRTSEVGRCEPIAILQHPAGRPKKIEAGTVLRAEGGSVFYDDIDTLGGSSGSGIRDLSGAVVGVHTNGGCNFDANRGVALTTIADVSSEI